MRIRIEPPAAKPYDVVGFGFNTLDHVCVLSRPVRPDAKQRLAHYLRQPGGQVPTALVALQRWGLRTSYVGPLGDDEGGSLQRSSLVAEGVDTAACRVRDGVASQLSVILVDQVTGARTVLWQRPPELELRVAELDRPRLTAGRALLMDAEDIDVAIAVAGWARSAGSMVMLDVDEPGPRSGELLAVSDAVVVSADFPMRLTGKRDLRAALGAMADFGPSLVAATLGEGGALAWHAGRVEHVPAFPVAAADTTSAGDLFHAGCLYGLLQGWAMRDTLCFAAAAAALECNRLGGRDAIPTLAEVRQLAQSAPRSVEA
jgi:sulfofructose kinase